VIHIYLRAVPLRDLRARFLRLPPDCDAPHPPLRDAVRDLRVRDLDLDLRDLDLDLRDLDRDLRPPVVRPRLRANASYP